LRVYVHNNHEDGYINERGTINMQRLQLLIDGMAEWEQEIFEKEYADMNWFKGKQSQHAKGAAKERRCRSVSLNLFSADILIHPGSC
jgi:5'-3' exoribonuclease 1